MSVQVIWGSAEGPCYWIQKGSFRMHMKVPVLPIGLLVNYVVKKHCQFPLFFFFFFFSPLVRYFFLRDRALCRYLLCRTPVYQSLTATKQEIVRMSAFLGLVHLKAAPKTRKSAAGYQGVLRTYKPWGYGTALLQK